MKYWLTTLSHAGNRLCWPEEIDTAVEAIVDLTARGEYAEGEAARTLIEKMDKERLADFLGELLLFWIKTVQRARHEKPK